MKTFSTLALCAPVLFAVSACSEPAETDAVDSEMSMEADPMTDPAMDAVPADDAMMAEDPMMTEDPAMEGEEPMEGDPAMEEEMPAEDM